MFYCAFTWDIVNKISLSMTRLWMLFDVCGAFIDTAHCVFDTGTGPPSVISFIWESNTPPVPDERIYVAPPISKTSIICEQMNAGMVCHITNCKWEFRKKILHRYPCTCRFIELKSNFYSVISTVGLKQHSSSVRIIWNIICEVHNAQDRQCIVVNYYLIDLSWALMVDRHYTVP